VGGNQKQIHYQQMAGMLYGTPHHAKDTNNNIQTCKRMEKAPTRAEMPNLEEINHPTTITVSTFWVFLCQYL
jgi:hypothetical protein